MTRTVLNFNQDFNVVRELSPLNLLDELRS